MKDCTHCKWAAWDRTAAGKLHPLGGGECTYKIVVRQLPAAFYWVFNPHHSGGFITRRRELKTHCTYYERRGND